MYKHILVPLDGSTLAESALEHVPAFVISRETRVTLMTVVDLPEAYVDWALEGYGPLTWPFVLAPAAIEATVPRPTAEAKKTALATIEAKVMGYLEQKAAPLRNRGIEVECVVEFGDPVTEILKYAKEHQVELIVMASHGRTGLGHLIFGSVAEAVLRSGITPVLVIRPRGLRQEPARTAGGLADQR